MDVKRVEGQRESFIILDRYTTSLRPPQETFHISSSLSALLLMFRIDLDQRLYLHSYLQKKRILIFDLAWQYISVMIYYASKLSLSRQHFGAHISRPLIGLRSIAQKFQNKSDPTLVLNPMVLKGCISRHLETLEKGQLKVADSTISEEEGLI